jgi:hypothetical protein
MFDTLIPEIVGLIVGFLDNKTDIFSVRLVCRRLYLKSYAAFGAACFHTVVSDLTPQSLRRLESIASHEKLRVFVRRLSIGEIKRPPILVVPEGGYPPSVDALGQGNHWPREESGCLDPSSPIAKTLKDWLETRLVNCREFEVIDSCGSYPERHGTDTSLSPTDAVRLLFLVIAAGNGLSIRSFRIHFSRSLSMSASQLSPGTLNSRSFRASWVSDLRDLEFKWILQEDACFEAALDLIITATHLKTLRLSWMISDSSEPFLHRLAAEPTLPALTDLRLNVQRVSQKALSNLLLRFKDSLTSLFFTRCDLASGTWSMLFGHIRRNGFSHLECITTFFCYENPNSLLFFCPLRQTPELVQNCGGTFEFVMRRCYGRRRVYAARYRGTGTGMQLALKALEECNYALKRHGPPVRVNLDEEPSAEGGPGRVVRMLDH